MAVSGFELVPVGDTISGLVSVYGQFRATATTSGGPDFAHDLCARKLAPAERAGLDLSSWTLAFDGAEPVRAATLERFAAAFAPHGLAAPPL